MLTESGRLLVWKLLSSDRLIKCNAFVSLVPARHASVVNCGRNFKQFFRKWLSTSSLIILDYDRNSTNSYRQNSQEFSRKSAGGGAEETSVFT